MMTKTRRRPSSRDFFGVSASVSSKLLPPRPTGPRPLMESPEERVAGANNSVIARCPTCPGAQRRTPPQRRALRASRRVEGAIPGAASLSTARRNPVAQFLTRLAPLKHALNASTIGGVSQLGTVLLARPALIPFLPRSPSFCAGNFSGLERRHRSSFDSVSKGGVACIEFLADRSGCGVCRDARLGQLLKASQRVRPPGALFDMGHLWHN